MAKYRPFDCGTQYADWTSRNCNRCVKGLGDEPKVGADGKFPWRCDLEGALFKGYWGDGTVDQHIAERMGALAAPVEALGWECPEWQPLPGEGADG